MGATQIIEMLYQAVNARLDIKRLQHVVPHKIGQVADRLHRHGLMKQLQRLIAFNAKTAAKFCAVGLERIKEQRAALTQARTQRSGRGSKI